MSMQLNRREPARRKGGSRRANTMSAQRADALSYPSLSARCVTADPKG
jgi:hypothetical protein